MWVRILGRWHVDLINLLTHLARFYLDEGKIRRAREAVRWAKRICNRYLEPDDPDSRDVTELEELLAGQ